MADADRPDLSFVAPTLTPKGPRPVTPTIRVRQSPALQAVDASRAREALRSRLGRVGLILAEGLGNRLAVAGTTASRVRFPADLTPFSDARLVVESPNVASRIDTSLVPADEARGYYRSFSRGFDPDGNDFEAGDYSIRMRLGQEAEEISFSVTDGQTNADVFATVADAVNAAALPVQAESVRQNAPEQKIDGLLGTGVVLAFAVNPGASSQDLELRNTEGIFLAELGLHAPAQALGQPALRSYSVQAGREAAPSLFRSSGFDPNAATTLTPGLHAFAWSKGDETGLIEVSVSDGDDWRDVLGAAASAINGAQSAFRAEAVDFQDSFYDPRVLGKVERDRVRLEVEAVDPKLGERLSLSAVDADTATEFGANLADYVTESGETVIISELGLNATAQPGTDATMAIDGRGRTRQPGTFTEDRGRVVMNLLDSFGERARVSVAEGVEVLVADMDELVNSASELRRYIERDPALWDPGLKERLFAPFDNERQALEQIGVEFIRDDFRPDEVRPEYERIGLPAFSEDFEPGPPSRRYVADFRTGGYAFDQETFRERLRQDPEQVRGLLLGSQDDPGLLPSFTSEVRSALKQGPANLLVPSESLDSLERYAERTLDNDMRAALLDLLE